MDYSIIKGFERSRLYGEFSWKRFENSIKVPALVLVGIWAMVLGMEIWKLGQLSANVVYFLY